MIVSPAVNAAAALLAERVSVLVPVPETLVGLKDPVTPVGKPGTDKLTAPANPFRPAIEIVLDPLEP